MNIGIVGSLGIVGSAHAFLFRKIGHTVVEYDIKLVSSHITDLLSTDIIFVCVPTPLNKDRECDTSIVEQVVRDLRNLGYGSIICVKSTITPGTTEKLISKYNSELIVFSSEHLRERSAISDIVEHHRLLAIGTHSDYVYEMVVKCYKSIPEKTVKLTPTQCELLKYFSNVFGALRVTVANEFYDICQKLGEEYYDIKEAFVFLNKLPNIYFDVNPETARSYDSICWNKDVPALVNFCKEELDLKLPVLENIEVSNERHIKTPFAGTRSHY